MNLVNGLVTLEISERVEALEAAIKEFAALAERWHPSRRLLVPDSSVFIQHDDQFEATDFAALLGGGPEPVHVLVPIAVVDELDSLKESKNKHARWRAGYSLAVLDRLLQSPSPATLRPADLREGSDGPPRGAVTVEVLFDPPGHTRLPIPDDEIIDRAVIAQAQAGTSVTLVTYDTGQSTRARVAGLRVNKLRGDAGQRSSGVVFGAFLGEGVDVGGVPGLARSAAGPLQLSVVDELPDVFDGDTEDLGGLVGGEVAGPQDLRLLTVSDASLQLECGQLRDLYG